MRFEVRITQAAWANAEGIYLWIRDKNLAPLAAKRWFNGWLAMVGKLETFPEGRARAPEDGILPGAEIFQQLFGAFRTLYVVRKSAVFVIHVRRATRQSATQEELLAGLEEAELG